MKYIIFLSIGLLFSVFVNGQEETKEKNKEEGISTYADKMPEPGFDIKKYLSDNLQYPEEARKNGITGRVMVKFVVTKTGVINDIRVLKGIGGGCDEEAVRVVARMPNWKPGMKNGAPVNVYFTQPIMFSLDGAPAAQGVPAPELRDDMPEGKNDTGNKPTIFAYVARMPAPTYDLKGYIQEHLYYPKVARRKSITGRVIVKFVVTETGAITNVTVLKGIGGGCDEEAMNLIEHMPPWRPGKKDGKPVSVYFTQPITFNLTN